MHVRIKTTVLQPAQEKLHPRTKKKKLGVRNEEKMYAVKSSEFNGNKVP